jgi:hypothetical protein
METSRRRWFLREYAKRNRNADMALVLDAVARVRTGAGGTAAGADVQGKSCGDLGGRQDSNRRGGFSGVGGSRELAA